MRTRSNEEQRSRIEVLEQVVSDSEKQLADLQKQHNVAQRDLEGFVKPHPIQRTSSRWHLLRVVLQQNS